MSAADVRQILDAHRAWLASDGTSGQCATAPGGLLSGADCRNARLSRADLRAAELTGADFSESDLSFAQLDDARLDGANLENADLTGAGLRRARLQGCRLNGIRGLAAATLTDADLQGATGLTGAEFAGADLTGVRLPGGLSFDALLGYVATSSQNARPAFLSILLSCVFVILTVFSTPDSALLSNESLALLPDLRTNIPAASFFWVAPALLLGLYVYLHLQMTGMGEALAELPRVFPDGTPLTRRAYPWMATSLLRLQGGWGRMRIEELMSIVLLWGAVPLTLVAIWLRYLPLRDWLVSFAHVALILAGTWGAMRLFEQTARLMCGDALRIRYRGALLAGLAVLLIAVTLAAGLLPIVLDVNPRRFPHFVVDIRDADLAGAVLNRKDLRHAAARESDLSRADLRDARLGRADFQRARFVGADLESADLRRTDLDAADFRNACLRKATLQDADMEDAEFSGAYLGRTDLRSPFLTRANFTGAVLLGTDLRGSNLTGARFDGAVLGCAILRKQDLEPDIACTDLTGAVLSRARFPGADLRRVVGLTQPQLDGACGDAATVLPAGLTLPACPAPEDDAPPAAEPPPAEANPCSHEIRDDHWPQ